VAGRYQDGALRLTCCLQADARVQAITESECTSGIQPRRTRRLGSLALGVLRMIKLFALEKKVQEDLAQKRAVELRYIQRGKLMQLANNIVKSVHPRARHRR
jgi:hypothetical protein